ncbi:MAG: dihydrodipicolinate synthase family protein [Spirochaetaceae bacterium]|nr:MAG: dihydrodipicolinate synthase family protein [Spirochaetaceae bacterium]
MTPLQNERERVVQTLFPRGIPRLWCPLLTHYREDRSMDSERIAAHIRHMRRWVSAFLAPGSTGDGWELSPPEAERLLSFLLQEAERQDFMVMAGILRTEAGTVVPAIRDFLERFSDGDGNAAALARRRICGFTVTPPKGATLDQAVILAELEAIAATGVPLSIYQLPQITENEMSPETVARLTDRFPNIYLLKDTSGRDAVVRSDVDLGNLFLVRGAEGEYAGWSRAAGGPYDGFLLSTANSFAAELGLMLQYLEEGEREAAEELSRRVTTAVEEIFTAAADLPFGNPFANANKAFDHHFAWGDDAPRIEPPMTHSGNRLPRELILAAGEALSRQGLESGPGYMRKA